MTSLSVIAPMPVWMTLTATSGCLILASSPTTASTRALHVALDDDVELLDAALAHAGEEVIQGDALLRAPRELLGAHALGTQPCEMAGLALVLDDARVLARGRRLVEAEDLDGRAGARFLDLLAAVVVERPHLAPRVAGDDAVPDPEGAARDEHRRDRAAADVQPALDDRAGGLGLRIRRQLELGVGDEEHLLDELVEALLVLGRDVRVLGRAAPLLGLEVVVHELLRVRASGWRRAGRSCSRRRRSAPRRRGRG